MVHGCEHTHSAHPPPFLDPEKKTRARQARMTDKHGGPWQQELRPYTHRLNVLGNNHNAL